MIKNVEINQAPFASTLMSSIKAAKDYYHNDQMSDAMLFGLSGHAFEVNITRTLGPCAPYNFDMKQFDQLVKNNIGLSIFDNSSVVTKDTQEEVKINASNKIKEYLDNNNLVLLSSYEFQVISSYDDTLLYTTIPWDAPSVTSALKVDTFEGMLDFFTFSKISKTEKQPLKEGVIQSLEYAIHTYEESYSTPDSAMGAKAYEFWLEQINEENAIGHGNWWTSNVWSESRNMASLYMHEIKPFFTNDALLEELSKQYKTSAELFLKLSNRESNKKVKVELIQELKDNEQNIITNLKLLLA